MDANGAAVSEILSLANAAPPDRIIRRLDVVIKVVERCNLACTYCYFFFGDNKSYERHPPKIAKSTLSDLAKFLRQGAIDLQLETIKLVFHGGEPTMMKQTEFDAMCRLFREQLSDLVILDLAIQTNATLISPGWIAQFKKHQVVVGVSLDGPEEYNDLMRRDHRGVGSYAAVVRGVKMLMDAADAGSIVRPGALFVINPAFDPAVIYKHLVDELGFKAIDALLPDVITVKDAVPYGRFLTGLFDAWVRNPNSDIYIRIFRALLDRFANRGSYQFPMDPSEDQFMSLNIASNGALSPDDIITDTRWPNAHVVNTSLREFVAHPLYLEWFAAGSKIPAECENCCWSNLCRGGHPWHRYEHDGRGFDRASKYCEGLKELYSHVTAFMLDNGYPLSNLLKQLELEEETVSKVTLHA